MRLNAQQFGLVVIAQAVMLAGLIGLALTVQSLSKGADGGESRTVEIAPAERCISLPLDLALVALRPSGR